MKLLLTEEFPPAFAGGINKIAQLDQCNHCIGHIDEVYPQPPHTGSSWFHPALRDGWMLLTMISDIKSHPQNLALWKSTGLVVFFPTPSFARLTFPSMAASILGQLSKLADVYSQRNDGGTYRLDPTHIRML
ncbi:PIN-like domain-containing protein [Azospirillum canadense]|uniref:PIN-like domain-containing protein n=1 Tax=Azospirillum canadense TaxID=403962 RepID=UPI00222795E5|nr:hypothetical protein [Azospirillum canadense]MCW2242908.1 hypothetical protein [Azospirillum canadense]